jgi:BirA family biotin operon repressor/biotin-[acetyl-CoA-carboxylase] ligase
LKDELLELLKNADGYISGEEIGEKLKVSRSAVWKEINALREDGYIIDAVTNRGYMLKESADVLNRVEIKNNIPGALIGTNIVCFDEVDSTNEVCKKMASEGLEEGSVIVAECQNGGKGRLGRKWVSQKGDGVWMSILLKPDVNPAGISSITLAAGLAVCFTLRNDFGIQSDIKWPNDILLNNKKICGILTEMSGQIAKVDYVVVGIGINVNIESFPDGIKNTATSLCIETGKKFKRSEIAKNVLKNFDSVYKRFQKDGFKCIKQEYEDMCINIGKRVRVIKHDGSFEATALEVNNNGELVIMKDNGEITTVFSGEVSVRGVY